MLGLSPPKAVPMPILARGDLHSSLPAALDTRPLYAQFGVVEGVLRVSLLAAKVDHWTTTDRSITAGHFDHRPRKKGGKRDDGVPGGLLLHSLSHFPSPLPPSPRGVNKLGGERGCRIILRYAHEKRRLETPDLWKEGSCCLN